MNDDDPEFPDNRRRLFPHRTTGLLVLAFFAGVAVAGMLLRWAL